MIRESGSLAGISINPATPVDVLFDLIDYFDMALIMSVDPGFYGQKFMPAAIGRIEKLRNFIEKKGSAAAIQIDGGIGEGNIASVVKAGANLIVAGNAVFKDGDPNAGARKLKSLCV
jgi:ribulose-phosphate 3-epimerase